MTDIETRDNALNWDVFVTPGIPTVTSDLPPGTHQRLWSPRSATLIYGERDAVLGDAVLTVEQAHALGEWVEAHGKHLTTIYATHGHGDHFFGASTMLQRFPRARLVATPDVVETIRQQASPQSLTSFWHPRFPGQIADQLELAEELTEHVLDLEGHALVVVPLGHTDTDNTTCLHVPSGGLVVAGDAVYNDVHLYLAESNPHTRREWIAALATISSLHPRAVIAGHKRPGNDDGPRIIEETRQYIRAFDQLAQATTTARSTTRCSRSIPIGSIRVHSGHQRGHSSRRKERRPEGWLQNNARVRATRRLLTDATSGESHWRLLRRDLLGNSSASEFYRA